jgi:hypothetical protein
MDERTAELLQRVLRRTGRSLLQYVAEAEPWVPGSDRATLDRLLTMVAEERDALAELTAFLRKQRVSPPYLGPYPEYFTTLNYLSLDRLVKLLVDHERQAVADLQAALSRTEGHEARHQVGRLLELKRRHLAGLSDLQGAGAPAGTVV